MTRKRVLYVTTQGATAYAVAKGRLLDEGDFNFDEPGLDEFSRYLQRERDSLFYLLGDVPEEDFQQENIPYVTGGDRAALLTRKLAQTFRDTKLSLAMSLGREPGGRRDERVLLAAFSNTQFFHPWLRVLNAHEIRLAGVYSIALTANALFRKLGLRQDKLLIISVHRSGIRQNYFEDGRIRFSRLTSTVEADARRSAEACVVESGKILQYLEGLRLVPREGAPLNVLVFAPHEQYGVFSEVCTGGQRLVFEVMDEQAAAAKIGLRSIPAGSRAEALYCFLLGQHAPAEQYASKPQRRLYRLWQARLGILAASGAVFAACLLFAGYQFLQIMDLRGKADSAMQQAARDAQRYEQVRQTFPAAPTSTENLKAAVQRFGELDRQAANPEILLNEISGVLNAYPAIELDQIEWGVARTPGDVGARDELRINPAQAPAAGAQTLAAPAGDKPYYQVAYLAGHIQLPNRIDYRGMLGYLNQFADGLKKIPGTRVDLVKLPFDTRSGAKLSGGISGDQTLQVPVFALRVSRKI
jgi:hypothetical protein